jgi:hypothetical protein
MTMKKNKVLMGLLSVLLMAGIFFTACPMNDDGGGDDGLGPGDLPGLPDGITAITEDEVEALLGKLVFLGAVVEDVNDVVGEASDDKDGSHEVTDNTTVEGLKINSTGRFSEDGDGKKETSVNFTADKTESDVTVYQGSLIELIEKRSWDAGGEKATSELTNFFGLTVSSGSKGGKVILNATPTRTLEGAGPEPDFTFAYKGSLTVYGQDDAVLYTLEIKDEASDSEALGYFGLERQDIFLSQKK